MWPSRLRVRESNVERRRADSRLVVSWTGSKHARQRGGLMLEVRRGLLRRSECGQVERLVR